MDSLKLLATPLGPLFVLGLLVFCFTTLLLGKIFQETKEPFSKFVIICAGIVSFIGISWFTFFAVVVYLEKHAALIASKYFPLNAAIKNTCYLDPRKVHCPRTSSEVIAIEDEAFTNLTKGAYLTYYYYPDSSEYTLIIRQNYVDKAVIFDPRLKTFHPYGFDFIDVRLSRCDRSHCIEDAIDNSLNSALKIFLAETALNKVVN